MQMIRYKEDIKDSVRTYFTKGKFYAIEDATIQRKTSWALCVL